MRNVSDFTPNLHGGLEPAIDAFLWHPQTAAELVTATECGFPAVVGIAKPLLEVFGAQIDDDEVRKFIGRRVRVRMAELGYQPERADVEIRVYPFSKGMRYSKGPTLYVYRATKDWAEACITKHRDASKLPQAPNGGRWRLWSTINDSLQASVGFGITDLKLEMANIEKDGYSRRKLQRMLHRG